MKHLFRNIFILSLALSLNCMPVLAVAPADPSPAAQTDKQKAAAAKKKEAEKRKKEAEKAKAAKAKQQAAADKKREADKKKAAAAKENAKKQAERNKAAEERAKQAEQRAEQQAKREAAIRAQEEKAKRDYAQYQAEQANPKTEPVSYFNLGLRAGYAAMMDKISPSENNMLWGSGTLNQSNALQQLKGGPGAGLDFTYNLEYGHFLFETGIDFRYLNSTSVYGFQVIRKDLTYGADYRYLFDNLRETRNLMQLGIPVMAGAQFSRYYFLLGAKVGYSLWSNYSQKGKYDIVVNDPALLEPYGMGIHDISGETNRKISFKQPEVSLAAEVGIDLDEWLQAQPDKKQTKVKPGQRLPFGREHIHYRVGLFAEYGLLNTNGTEPAQPIEFTATEVKAGKTNTMLTVKDTKLNNLFVGAKFTVQFEVPGKKARPVPPPASYAIYTVVDAATNQPLQTAFIETRDTKSGKVVIKEKQIGAKGLQQRQGVSSFVTTVRAEGYYTATHEFDIMEVGARQYVTIALRQMPVLRVHITNKETGASVPATVQIYTRGTTEPTYSLQTDSVSGSAKRMLAEGQSYTLHIAQTGYETLDMPIAHIGDSLNIALVPVKKGEVFVMRNLFFATNKTRILSSSEQALQDLFMYLERNPEIRVKIIGHTDNVGKDAANQKLSEGRAAAVRDDLVKRGIDPARIEAEGRGESQPIDTNDTEEGRQNNRRVEIEIL